MKTLLMVTLLVSLILSGPAHANSQTGNVFISADEKMGVVVIGDGRDADPNHFGPAKRLFDALRVPSIVDPSSNSAKKSALIMNNEFSISCTDARTSTLCVMVVQNAPDHSQISIRDGLIRYDVFMAEMAPYFGLSETENRSYYFNFKDDQSGRTKSITEIDVQIDQFSFRTQKY